MVASGLEARGLVPARSYGNGLGLQEQGVFGLEKGER